MVLVQPQRHGIKRVIGTYPNYRYNLETFLKNLETRTKIVTRRLCLSKLKTRYKKREQNVVKGILDNLLIIKIISFINYDGLMVII